MQEYEEDFFFEEDKILPKESKLTCCKFSSSSRSAQGFQEKTDHLHSNLELSILVDINEEKNEKNVNENMSDAMKKKQNSTTEAKDEVLSVEIQELSPECVINDLRQERYQLMYQNLLGMTVTSGNVTILKDDSNLIGISIGGGAPLCPCLYIVQVFDNTPAAKEGTLQSGDELVGVNGHSVKGKTKVEVAKMIQSAKEEVNINYNKLHADPQQGKSLDIVLKKVKHRIVENMSTSTADALGLSRAILCNDTLVKKLQELQNTEHMYKGLVEHAKRMLKAYFDLLQTYKNFGDVFSSIGVREPQPRASEAFSQFGAYHRQMEKDGIKMLKAVKPVLSDMGTYLNKAIPDTKLTIKKYADTKFEYLSYCLKVKEMDDEEYSYGALQEPLYRVETGNYEYRLILRCRQDARNRFARLRSDVLVKMELLDNKHVQDVVWQLQRFINGIAKFHEECLELSMANGKLFPVEVDLSQNAFQYKSTANFLQDEDDEESVQEIGNEVKEHYDVSTKRKDKKRHDQSSRTEGDNDPSSSTSLLSLSDEQTDSNVADSMSENTKLLAELGLSDTTTTPFDPNMMNSNSDLDMLNFSDGNNPSDFFNVDLMEKKTSPVADFKDMLKNGEDMSFTEFLSHTTCNSYSSGSGVKKESLDLITGLD